MSAPGTVLVIQHVPWEGPHRIARSVERAGLRLEVRHPLDGEPLPEPEGLAGAVIMGGPMNVDQTDRHPGLAVERAWIERALTLDLPVLGVCLGSQLLARALGAPVTPGPRPEIGWHQVTVSVSDDPLLGAFAPETTVLHWHGDRYPLPPGATLLARSALTDCQAFRHGNAWGVLFHAEADEALCEQWLAEPGMRNEAVAALGSWAPDTLRAGAAVHSDDLQARSEPGFAALAALMVARADAA